MLNKVKEWLCGFEGDKYVHVMSCWLIAFIVARVVSPFLGRWIGAATGAVAAIVFGVLKEYFKDDHVDRQDIKADAVGAVLGGLQSLI